MNLKDIDKINLKQILLRKIKALGFILKHLK